jgi:hypothetical protein
MSFIFPTGLAIVFLALFVSLIFSFTTVRRLRKIPHRTYEFEPQDLYSGADITAIAVAASTPKWWREYRARQGHNMLHDKHEWVMANTRLWERIIARIFIVLLYIGLALMMIGIIENAIFG